MHYFVCEDPLFFSMTPSLILEKVVSCYLLSAIHIPTMGSYTTITSSRDWGILSMRTLTFDFYLKYKMVIKAPLTNTGYDPYHNGSNSLCKHDTETIYWLQHASRWGWVSFIRNNNFHLNFPFFSSNVVSKHTMIRLILWGNPSGLYLTKMPSHRWD